MALKTSTVIEELSSRASSKSDVSASEDLSGGKEVPVGDVTKFTVFLKVEGAVDVDIELSPDGENWYRPGEADNTPDESPIKFTSAGTEIVALGYAADYVRVTATNDTPVSVQVKEVV
ncbi:hypothetical protein HSRCO_0277 [Halanaeroarchaeum sp. HSR-CO]|uniref:hypothetical protein n=1 Tax=Halanaeroarchaeum sp. HSR-CO TaxID=2866382 RepID=UPI00217ED2AE|nr:hypothetical protein [Halanaeroarchaeum sp. HSR-CO]UWG46576.1 hypothetical protein HSRCO_0277 [Halanaeroarchaeum sp. HSR-CO]